MASRGTAGGSGVEFVPDDGPPGYSPPPPTVPPTVPPTGPPDVPPTGAGDEYPDADGTPVVPGERLGRHSLTSKLVVGVVSLVVVLVAIVSAGTYFALKSFLDDRLDQQLRATAVQNAGYFERCLHRATPDDNGNYSCPSGPQSQEEWVAAIDPTAGKFYLFSSSSSAYGSYGNELRQLTLTQSERSGIVDDRERVFTTTVGGDELRVASEAAPDSSLIVATGLSTDEIHRTLRQLVLLEMFIGGAAIVVALVTTSLGVRFSLRRLRGVTTTAQEVAAELSPEGRGLDRRVPVTEEGTEVGQLAESLNTLLGAVETQFAARLESEHRMRQFLADASHELRTPLTSIRGYAELARMQRRAADPEQQGDGENLDRIEAEGLRMSRLVEDLLMLARGDADRDDRPVTRELIDVGVLVDDAVAGVHAAFPDREISTVTAPEAHVLGDPDQLLRVVRNLVTNAAVHTATDRPILVRSRTDGQGVAIQVIDGGPGLPPAEAAHVFERFWRADKARSRARGGTGLGLSIVASIVRAHEGTVRFDSTVEGGSTVTVWLPAVDPH